VETIRDFEDMLALLHRHRAQYLIVGGLAFIFHAKPRFTKNIDLWINPTRENLRRTNQALAEFGSPELLEFGHRDQILQLGVPPSRIDLILEMPGVRFATAWRKRLRSRYGHAPANWIDLDSLIRAKSRIRQPRHQEDARVLRAVKRMQKKR
jgi:hypothetical protein